MDKIKEIEKLYKEAVSVTWFQNAIRYLLSHIKELEGGIEKDSHWKEDWQKLNKHMVEKLNLLIDKEVRVNELEDKLTVLQDHANSLGEIIHNQTKIRIGLEGELTVANEQVKELERVIEGDERIKQLEKEKDEIPV